MGVAAPVLQSALRFSFSHLLTEAQVTDAARHIADGDVAQPSQHRALDC